MMMMMMKEKKKEKDVGEKGYVNVHEKRRRRMMVMNRMRDVK